MQVLRDLIGPDGGGAAWWQLCVRAVVLFLIGIACIRVAGRRTFSHATPLDIIVAIIVGSNLSRAMTGRAPFVGGVAASLALVLLHRAVAMATVRWNGLAWLVKGKPGVVIEDGRVDPKAMLRHGVSREDLLASLRMEQMEDPKDVRLATVETGGRISVVPKRPR